LGKCGGRPPYGYLAHNGSIQEWDIDEPAAEIVREIYRRMIAGDGPGILARALAGRGIDTPFVHYRKSKGLPPLNEDTTWTSFVVSRILENPAYIGNLVSQKVSTPSYKNHKQFTRPEDEWVIFEAHHTPIVDKETFDVVQKLRANRCRLSKRGELSVLSGLLRCSDCGSNLSSAGTQEGKYRYYICQLYRNQQKRFKNGCSRHSIEQSVIEQIVLDEIIKVVAYARQDKVKFAEKVRKSTDKESEKTMRKKAAELVKADSRIEELDKIIKRIYEDNVAGKLSDERFSKMLADYETEQKSLSLGAEGLRAEVEELKSKAADVQSFLKLVDRFADITELTADVARTFIEKVVVHEAVYAENGKKKTYHAKISQEIHVFFNCIGEFTSE
jgi:hypothetical protein